MKKLVLILFISIIGKACIAQRYTLQIFDNTKKETILYYKERGLQLDVYQGVNDTISNRPLVIYVHGGGFAGGKRDEPDIVDFCENLARRGYVVASLSYTLTMKGKSFGCDRPAKEKLATFKQTAEEINMATNYFIENKVEFKINSDLIVLAGSSAGAEAIVHAAYWPDTQLALPDRFKYAGLISMAGAIYDIDMINAATAIPMMFFHGTCDNLVPYGTAPHHYCNEDSVGYLMLHGSASMVDRLKTLHVGYYLLTGCNDGHEWNSRPFKEYTSEIAYFLSQDVIAKRFRQTHEVIRTNRNCKLASILPEICSND